MSPIIAKPTSPVSRSKSVMGSGIAIGWSPVEDPSVAITGVEKLSLCL